MPPRSRILFAPAFLILLASAIAGMAHAGPWTFSAGAGGMFAIAGDPRWPYLDPDWTAGLSATHALGEHLALRGLAGWSRYGRNVARESILPADLNDYVGGPSRDHQTVEFWRAGLGARLYPDPRRSPRVRAYVDLAPVLVLSRWKDRYLAATNESHVLAGLEAGLGFEWRRQQHLRPALGIRFLATTGPGHVPVVSSAALRGLLELAAEASIGWSP